MRYAVANDGVSIAYTVAGEGMPFVSMPPIPMSFTAGHAEIPEWDAWNEQIVRKRMLICYDCRGAGLSDRDVSDYSLDAWLMDLQAVVDSLGMERVVLFAPGALAVPVAIAYAARRPERVSHLILWQGSAQPAQSDHQNAQSVVLSLVDKDWVLFTETLAHSIEGWSEPETARRSAALMRENHTPQGLGAAFAASAEIDVSSLLPDVKARTLVLHRRESSHDLGASRKLLRASLAPNW